MSTAGNAVAATGRVQSWAKTHSQPHAVISFQPGMVGGGELHLFAPQHPTTVNVYAVNKIFTSL